MSIEIYALIPTTSRWREFHISSYWWGHLWEFVLKSCPTAEVLGDGGFYNNGLVMSAEASAKLHGELMSAIALGGAERHIELLKQRLEIQEEVRESLEFAKLQSESAVALEWLGSEQWDGVPFSKATTLDFADFLARCGGFQVL